MYERILHMVKKKNQKEAETQAKKSAAETLRFQAHWGRNNSATRIMICSTNS